MKWKVQCGWRSSQVQTFCVSLAVIVILDLVARKVLGGLKCLMWTGTSLSCHWLSP